MDFIDIYGDALDVVLWAPLWTDLYRDNMWVCYGTPVVGGVASVSTTMVG